VVSFISLSLKDTGSGGKVIMALSFLLFSNFLYEIVMIITISRIVIFKEILHRKGPFYCFLGSVTSNTEISKVNFP